MSSKFSNLLSQARSRSTEDAELAPEDTAPTVATPIQEEPLETKQQEVTPAPPTTKKSKVASMPKSVHTSRPELQEASSETQKATRGRPRTGKSSNPNYTQITAYITKQTHKDIKLALLLEGEEREISELIEERLLEWLHNRR